MTAMTSLDAHPLAKIDWDYIEFYVGNAKQAAHYYCSAFGFDRVAYAGPETGVSDRASYVLVQNNLRFVLTASLRPDGEITEHVARHGDGIKDVAILVGDAKQAYRAAIAAGATPVLEPTEYRDAEGRVVKATIAAYGDTVHNFIQRDGYGGAFMPGYVSDPKTFGATQKPELQFVDHCVGNVGWGEMDSWGEFYAKVFGFSQTDLVRRQGHFHRVYRAQVKGNDRRAASREVSHQRAGAR